MIVAKIINQNEVDVLHCINNTQLEELKQDGYLEYIQTNKPICEQGTKSISIYQEIDRKIVQRWDLVYDNQFEISSLKERLSSSDYKITKCMEAQLLGDSLPYDINELHTERQQIRDKINELEI